MADPRTSMEEGDGTDDIAMDHGYGINSCHRAKGSPSLVIRGLVDMYGC